MPKIPARELTPKQRTILVEAMDGKESGESAEEKGLSQTAIIARGKGDGINGWWGAREQRRRADLDEILDVLRDMVRKKPETAYRWADKLGAMKLQSELEGHLKTNTEEKHLHLHGVQLDQLSEAQLRQELNKMHNSNLTSGTPSVQKPLVRDDISAKESQE